MSLLRYFPKNYHLAVFSLRSVIQTVTHFFIHLPRSCPTPPLPPPLCFIYFLSFRIFFLHHCIDVNHTKIFTRLKIVLNLCLRCPFFFYFSFHIPSFILSLFLYSTPNPHFFTLTLFFSLFTTSFSFLPLSFSFSVSFVFLPFLLFYSLLFICPHPFFFYYSNLHSTFSFSFILHYFFSFFLPCQEEYPCKSWV